MIDHQQYQRAVERASAMLQRAGVVITSAERERFEVADFGLGELEKTGLQIITYVNTQRWEKRKRSVAAGGRSICMCQASRLLLSLVRRQEAPRPITPSIEKSA